MKTLKVLFALLPVLLYMNSVTGQNSLDYLSGQMIHKSQNNNPNKYNYSFEVKLQVLTQKMPPDSVTFAMGDGLFKKTELTSYQRIESFFLTQYKNEHTYPGAGLYYLRYTDTNISFIDKGFYVSAENRIRSSYNMMMANNNLTYKLFPYKVKKNDTFRFNPMKKDGNGDSLRFSFTTPKNSDYSIPKNATIDAEYGTITWEAPDSTGLYRFIVKTEEYRLIPIELLITKVGEAYYPFTIRVTENKPPEGEFELNNSWPQQDGHYYIKRPQGDSLDLQLTFKNTQADSVKINA